MKKIVVTYWDCLDQNTGFNIKTKICDSMSEAEEFIKDYLASDDSIEEDYQRFGFTLSESFKEILNGGRIYTHQQDLDLSDKSNLNGWDEFFKVYRFQDPLRIDLSEGERQILVSLV